MNKILLIKLTATRPLTGPNGLIYSAPQRTELFADTLENQFALNPGHDVSEIAASLQEISSINTPGRTYTSPGTVTEIIQKFPTRKAPGEDTITNATLKNLPKSAVLLLIRILNGSLWDGNFPKIWKKKP